MPDCSLKIWTVLLYCQLTGGMAHINEGHHREWAGDALSFNLWVWLSCCVGSCLKAISLINSPKTDALNNMKYIRVHVSGDGESAMWLGRYKKMFLIECCIFISKFPVCFIAVELHDNHAKPMELLWYPTTAIQSTKFLQDERNATLKTLTYCVI